MSAVSNTSKHIIKVAQGVNPTKEQTERTWRDSELKRTDWIIPTTDHPQHDQYLVYRQALRDWPSGVNFPDTRPVL